MKKVFLVIMVFVLAGCGGSGGVSLDSLKTKTFTQAQVTNLFAAAIAGGASSSSMDVANLTQEVEVSTITPSTMVYEKVGDTLDDGSVVTKAEVFTSTGQYASSTNNTFYQVQATIPNTYIHTEKEEYGYNGTLFDYQMAGDKNGYNKTCSENVYIEYVLGYQETHDPVQPIGGIETQAISGSIIFQIVVEDPSSKARVVVGGQQSCDYSVVLTSGVGITSGTVCGQDISTIQKIDWCTDIIG